MCRFFCYLGAESLMFDAMYNAEHSLIEQSKSANKRNRPVNGDGCGIGWYPTHNDPEPGTYVAIDPAWNQGNLKDLCAKIKTSCFFAHIRDASEGMPVSMSNCHPFKFERYLWMHNGHLSDFEKIKRPIINQLSQRAFLQIKGNTDAEFAFALFLDQIKFDQTASIAKIQAALVATIELIMQLRRQHQADSCAFMNFVVSNGECLISTRFATHGDEQPASLFYTTAKMNLNNKSLHFSSCEPHQSVIICSEPITRCSSVWHKINRNHMIVVNKKLKVSIKTIPLEHQVNLNV